MQRRVLEVSNTLVSSLNSGVSDGTNFIRIEFPPFFTIEFQKKIFDRSFLDEVDKGVTHIALILKVNGQIEEIVLFFKLFVEFIHHHFLRIFVWNVLDH